MQRREGRQADASVVDAVHARVDASVVPVAQLPLGRLRAALAAAGHGDTAALRRGAGRWGPTHPYPSEPCRRSMVVGEDAFARALHNSMFSSAERQTSTDDLANWGVAVVIGEVVEDELWRHVIEGLENPQEKRRVAPQQEKLWFEDVDLAVPPDVEDGFSDDGDLPSPNEEEECVYPTATREVVVAVIEDEIPVRRVRDRDFFVGDDNVWRRVPAYAPIPDLAEDFEEEGDDDDDVAEIEAPPPDPLAVAATKARNELRRYRKVLEGYMPDKSPVRRESRTDREGPRVAALWAALAAREAAALKKRADESDVDEDVDPQCVVTIVRCGGLRASTVEDALVELAAAPVDPTLADAPTVAALATAALRETTAAKALEAWVKSRQDFEVKGPERAALGSVAVKLVRHRAGFPWADDDSIGAGLCGGSTQDSMLAVGDEYLAGCLECEAAWGEDQVVSLVRSPCFLFFDAALAVALRRSMPRAVAAILSQAAKHDAVTVGLAAVDAVVRAYADPSLKQTPLVKTRRAAAIGHLLRPRHRDLDAADDRRARPRAPLCLALLRLATLHRLHLVPNVLHYDFNRLLADVIDVYVATRPPDDVPEASPLITARPGVAPTPAPAADEPDDTSPPPWDAAVALWLDETAAAAVTASEDSSEQTSSPVDNHMSGINGALLTDEAPPPPLPVVEDEDRPSYHVPSPRTPRRKFVAPSIASQPSPTTPIHQRPLPQPAA